ncbi:A/G-specific adenine glycosylase [Thalassospira sp.]|uniref:A/G-specific adenine glycosylase n=1 Tax=Thalassospira sp. TaxID=1912094 RepID=UPI002734ECE4|nr:A/G-specific adenine glycosylase [Thalassospira sp.]MDP2696604.1 A/G-specific adenine glycosylase [Thalassospira sp.]
MHFTPEETHALGRTMLDWYDRHHRTLPWRAEPGETPDPYHVWLSEIMLQQTTVITVGPYFSAFLGRWPTVTDLANADLDEVLHAWQGLGYYARARNLHKCAQVVARDHNGIFPDTEDGLLSLPGIGPYTAAAVAAIAFNRHTSPVDGNIERVISRLFALTTPLPDVKPDIKEKSAVLTPPDRPGDYAQALMDLGATICTPRNPACGICPWQTPCEGRKIGIAADLPKKRKKPAKPTRVGYAFWVVRDDGQILLRRRPEKGLLGGMYEIPGSDWRVIDAPDDVMLSEAPIKATWQELDGTVGHTFTHFHLEITVLTTRTSTNNPDDINGVWTTIDGLADYALPTLMKKIVRHALTHG